MASALDVIRAIETDDLDALRRAGDAAPKALRAFVSVDPAAGPEDYDQETWLPLHFAAAGGHAGAVALLIDAFDVSVDPRTRYRLPTRARRTPLMLAAERGHDTVVAALLDRGAEVEVRDALGDAPLGLAARAGHGAIVARLLDRGADPDAADGQGRTPLHLTLLGARDAAAPGADAGARDASCVAVALTLIEHGVDVDHACPREPEGFTPLHRAVTAGPPALPVIEALLQRGADTTRADPRFHRTPLDLAQQRLDDQDAADADAWRPVVDALQR